MDQNHDAQSTVKRTRGQSTSGGSFMQRQRAQLTRLQTSRDEPMPTSPPPVQRTFVRTRQNPNDHSRQSSTATDNSSLRSYGNDSGFASGVLGSPDLSSRSIDTSFSPSFTKASQPTPQSFSPTSNSYPSTFGGRVNDSVPPLTLNTAPSQNTFQRRQASRTRNDISSRSLQPHREVETMGDFALEHLFTSFVKQADKKIEDCASSVAKDRISEEHIEQVCASGVDSLFDQHLAALGKVVSDRPRIVIDKLMTWKGGHDRQQAHQLNIPDAKKANNDASRYSPDVPSNPKFGQQPAQLFMNGPDAVMSDRRSSAATYLLLRALIDVLNQTTLQQLGQSLAVKLEDIIFQHTVNQVSREEMKKSALQRAKWDKAVEVLGVLSSLDFAGVSGRYTTVLKACQKFLDDPRGGDTTEALDKLHNMLKGMRELLPRSEPETAWMNFSSCMGDLVELFNSAHGAGPKGQYCRMFEILLLRLSHQNTIIQDDSKWRNIVATLNDRLAKLVAKPKYWHYAYPAQIALTCVSPTDVFLARWQPIVSSLSTRLRDTQKRAVLLKTTCRLVWAALNRQLNNDSMVARLLEDTIKTIFLSAKRYSLSREPYISEPLIEFVRIVASSSPEYAFRHILFPLVHIDLLSSTNEPDYRSLDPDKIILGIRSFLAVVSDLENGVKSIFPFDFVDERDAIVQDDMPHTPISPTINRPNQPQSQKTNLIRGDRLSRPVTTTTFSQSVKEDYNKFCELLSKIFRVCDTAFGGQASLDEKFGSAPTRTPFVDAWSFARRDDDENQAERTGKFGFLDLLHVVVQAIPRCLSPHIPVKVVIDLLCTGTAHTEQNIAISSATSLKSIARQGYAELTASRFSFFIFKYDHKYSTIAAGGLLGPSHIESTLRLYNELLKIWENELLERAAQAPLGQLNTSNTQTQIDSVEAKGLFLLCSPSARVRAFAVEVLAMVTRLDEALGESNLRIHGILTGATPSDGAPSFLPRDSELSHIEKAKLDKCKQASNIKTAFVKLCSSTSHEDIELWYKLFPLFVQASHKLCPLSVVQTQTDVCNRLQQIQTQIEVQAEEQRPRATTLSSNDASTPRDGSRASVHIPDHVLEQYRLYLVFACSTRHSTDNTANTPIPDSSHMRTSSTSSSTGSSNFGSAPDMFAKVVPMIYSDNRQLRHAVVTGLSSINEGLFQLLLQSINTHVQSLSSDSRHQLSHSRSASSPRRFRPHHVYQGELLQIYERTSQFLIQGDSISNTWIMHHLAEFSWGLHEYLRQDDLPDSNGLRRHYCGLTENFFLGANRTSEPERWMPFAKRKSHFVTIEGWYGDVTAKDARIPAQGPLSPDLTSGLAIDQRSVARENDRLRVASSSAMATLCAGPFKAPDSVPADQFNVQRLLAWIDTVFELKGDKPQSTGKRALINLITHNPKVAYITEKTIAKLFRPTKSATTETYLDVLLEIFSKPQYPTIQGWKLVSAVLFALGHPESSIRMKSSRLLRIFEEHDKTGSQLRKYDIGLSDRTKAVNSQAHFDLTNEILRVHSSSDYAYHIFSEYSKHFVDIEPDSQRNMVLVLLPWMRVIELKKDRNGAYMTSTYMVLLNMLNITKETGTKLHHEVRALWGNLVMGEHPDNIRYILDFIIDLSLTERDQSFIRIVKQVVVFLAHDEATKVRVVESLMRNIEPKSLNGTNPKIEYYPPGGLQSLPYVVDYKKLFPDDPPKMRMSHGQLSLILLVDLIVSDTSMATEKLPAVLQIILVLWDHHLSIVQEQAREMLVHLVHAFVIAKTSQEQISDRKPSIEELVELIRRNDAKIVWAYGDNSDPNSPFELPTSMSYVISETIALFRITVPDIEEAWGGTAIDWALQCPVRHVACRSLQIYRLIRQPMDMSTLREILYRLSSTLSEQDPDIQAYVADLLRTVKTIGMSQRAGSSLLGPAFWASSVTLGSIYEWEFLAASSILEGLIHKHDLKQESQNILRFTPKDTNATLLSGFSSALGKGCSSATSYDKSVNLINRTLRIACSSDVPNFGYLRMALLANLPQMLYSFEDSTFKPNCIQAAAALRDCCESLRQESLALIFQDFLNGQLGKKDFVFKIFKNKRISLLEKLDYESTEYLMRLLLNPMPWMKRQTLHILRHLLSRLDSQDGRIQENGLDLFTPLLQLLQTEYSSDALDIIKEHLVFLTGPSRDILSLQPVQSPSESGRAGRSQTVNAGVLYGTPTSTGWTVANVDRGKELARQNILSICHKLAKMDPTSGSTTLTPEIEFLKEEPHDSYFPENATGDPSASVVSSAVDNRPMWEMEDTTMSTLAAQIGDLDDFFEEEPDSMSLEPDRSSQSTIKPLRRDQNPFTAGHRSKQPSTQSLNPFSHRKYGSNASMMSEASHHSPVLAGKALPHPASQPMSPSAFVTPQTSFTSSQNSDSRPPSRRKDSDAKPPTRPGLVGRSITSPPSQIQTTPPDKAIPRPTIDLDALSDDEMISGRSRANSGVDRSDSNPPSRSSTPQKPFSSLRNSIKRLAGSERHRRTNTKAQVEVDGSVPPVPNLPLPSSKEHSSSSDLT